MLKFCHIDTETTGVDPNRHGVIQVAGIIERPGSDDIEFNVRAKPFESDEINAKALEVNNVTTEQLRTLPAPGVAKQLLRKIFTAAVNQYDKTDKMFFIGFNGTFDFNMMHSFWKKNGDNFLGSLFWFPVIDTAVLAGIMLLERRQHMQNFKLGTACEALGLGWDEEKAHDALYDVRMSRKIFDLYYRTHGRAIVQSCSDKNCMKRTLVQ